MSTAAIPISRYRPPLPRSMIATPQGSTLDPGIYGPGYDASGVNSGEYASPTDSSQIPTLNTDPNQDIHNMFYNDQAIENGMNRGIYQEGTSQLGYYGPLQQQAQQQEEQALGELKATPGYTAPEQSQVNVDYSQFNTPTSKLDAQFLTPEEQAREAGNPNQPADQMKAGTAAEGAMLNQYQGNLGGQVGNFDKWTGDAVGNLKTGLAGSQDFSKLDTAVNNPALAFDPKGTEKQLSDADVQEMKTAAGTRIGNQYKSAQDTLMRNAAAAGNTSPLAIAAANARLQTQESADQGDAETNADIAARQAQYQRASGIEGQREGATQTQAGMKASAAEQEQSQGQNASALAGTAGISAAEAEGNVGLNAANQYGQFSTTTAGDIANKDYGAAQNAETEAAARAAAIAGNRQQTQTGVNQTQYQQGTGSAGLTSAGAQDTANARIAGEGSYRSGVSQQQALAQQGGQTAVGQQQDAAKTLGGDLNQSTADRSGYETAGTGNSALNQATRVVSSVLDEGGVVTEPTIALIGERRPEMVIPLKTGPRYRSEREAA